MQHCQWLIWVPLGYRIRLQFTAFRLQDCQNCSCDNVTIYDGAYLQQPRLGHYCGYKLPPPIFSSGNQVLVTFQSDGFYSEFRFRLEYSSKYTGEHLQLRGDFYATPGEYSPINVTGCSSENFENTPKRYQNLVLWACPKFISTLKWYQFNNN